MATSKEVDLAARLREYMESWDEPHRITYAVAQEVLRDTLVLHNTTGFIQFDKKRRAEEEKQRAEEEKQRAE